MSADRPSANDPVVTDADPWYPMRDLTQARIGLQRRGTALSTADVLRFHTDHAAARDAVHAPLDAAAVVDGLRDLGLGEPVTVSSRATTRAEYLRRPDLGRTPGDLTAIEHSDADIGVVLADGLSATAVESHGVALTAAVVAAITPRRRVAAPVIATQARVALGDAIGAAMGVDVVLVIVGERPGLSVADSLGIYLTFRPRPGRRDSERNCISNIHPPDGLGHEDAARRVATLIDGAYRLGSSGVALKDTSPATESTPPTELRRTESGGGVAG